MGTVLQFILVSFRGSFLQRERGRNDNKLAALIGELHFSCLLLSVVVLKKFPDVANVLWI